MTAPTSIPSNKPSAGIEAFRNGDPLQSMRRFARLLDDIIRVPGTKIGIGLDPLLNLIPFAGDAVGTLMSVYLLVTAVRMNVPKRILARMFVNIGVDALVGAIPALGQIFDFIWKANTKNMALLERYAQMPDATKKTSTAVLVVVLTGVLALLVLVMLFAYWFLKFVASLLNLPLW